MITRIGLVLICFACAALLLTPDYILAPLAGLAFGGGLVLAYWPVLGLYLIVGLEVSDPLRSGIDPLGGLSIPKLTGVALIGLAMLQVAMGRLDVRNGRTHLWSPILGLVALHVFAIFWAPKGALAIDVLLDLLPAIILFVLLLLYRDQLNLDWLARIIAGALMVVCVLQFFVDTGNLENGRPSGFSTDPNAFGMLLTVAMPLSVCLAACERVIVLRVFWAAGFLLQAHALFETFSRSSAMVAGVTAALAFVLLLPFLRRKDVIRFGAACAVGAGVLIAAAPDGYVERLKSLTQVVTGLSQVEDRSLGRRTAYVIVAAHMFEQRPVLGHGPGTYPYHFAESEFAAAFATRLEQESYYRRAHNTYLEVAAEMGMLGVICFGAIIFLGGLNYLRAWRLSCQIPDWSIRMQTLAFGLSFAAGAMSLFFLSAQDHKFVWALLAVSVVLRGRIIQHLDAENT